MSDSAPSATQPVIPETCLHGEESWYCVVCQNEERTAAALKIVKLEAELSLSRTALAKTSFWVIEQFVDGKSQGYWFGNSSREFSTDIDKAIQFRRREDAARVKSAWHWKDTEVTEHMYVPLPSAHNATVRR